MITGEHAYLESDIFDVTDNLSPAREKCDGASWQVPDIELLLVRPVCVHVDQRAGNWVV
jgi:hypothetical protein